MPEEQTYQEYWQSAFQTWVETRALARTGQMFSDLGLGLVALTFPSWMFDSDEVALTPKAVRWFDAHVFSTLRVATRIARWTRDHLEVDSKLGLGKSVVIGAAGGLATLAVGALGIGAMYAGIFARFAVIGAASCVGCVPVVLGGALVGVAAVEDGVVRAPATLGSFGRWIGAVAKRFAALPVRGTAGEAQPSKYLGHPEVDFNATADLPGIPKTEPQLTLPTPVTITAMANMSRGNRLKATNIWAPAAVRHCG